MRRARTGQGITLTPYNAAIGVRLFTNPKTFSGMNALDITIISLLAVFAAACLIVAILFSAWWHVYPAVCFASLAGAWYNEEKPE